MRHEQIADHQRAQSAEFFKRHGFTEDRQTGSHIIMEKDGVARPVVIPDKREVPAGIILNNLNTAGISRAEFVAEAGKRKRRGK